MTIQISKGFRALVSEAEKQTTGLTVNEVAGRLGEPGLILVDLRDIREIRREGKIPGALHVPRGMLEFWVDPDSPYYRREFDDADSLILYCNKGWRSALAARTLQDMGVKNVAHMLGGMEKWQAESREIEAPRDS